jgi:chorismate mutase
MPPESLSGNFAKELIMSKVRGIRGAVRVKENTAEAIFAATTELVQKIIEENQIDPADIAFAIFTATPDLDADFPAYAARQLGWTMVPLICAREIDVPHGMKSVIRVLMNVNTEKEQSQIKHQYLGETRIFRPDLYERKNDDSNYEI